MSIHLYFPLPHLAVLQVSRPGVRNALNWQAIQDFRDHIDQIAALPDLRACILTGTGSAFISGGDLKELSEYPSRADGLRLSRLMSEALLRLENLPCPTIAAINGPARGGGAEISLACDLRVMAEDADLGFVQVNLGLTPGWGAGQRLLRLVGYSLALEWLATGRILTASQAGEYHLANQIVPSGVALDASIELASEIASKPPEAVRAMKRLLQVGLQLPPASAAWLEQEEFPALWAGAAHLNAVQRFLESRQTETENNS